ncbi:hypothetical protein NUW54_g4094 [Trametes sanguinea]|uniref:Uncharacterized protein n=1 Tax=Trametes sanguinea TaxID=158606 RepID=A0ACC1Q0H9_9APHY|nr:hypothetical protein NUW54_g4094 [Trametes sanguinea]
MEKIGFSTLEDEARAELVSTLGGGIVQPLSVEGKTEGCLDAGAEGLCVAYGEDTRVVDLRLDGGGVVKVDLGTNLKSDVARGCCAGVVDRLGTSLNVGAAKTGKQRHQFSGGKRAISPSWLREEMSGWDKHPAGLTVDLVYPEGKWNELPLGPQPPRVRKVAHLAIYKVSVCVLFENAFPEGSTAQSLYAGKALIESAAELEFHDVKLRLETDKQYSHDLGTIPSQRIATLRGPVKKTAAPLISTVYGLNPSGCKEDVEWLLSGLQYIYPYHPSTKPNTPVQKRRLATTQPYRNDAILEVLHCSFFDGQPSIAEKYKKEFKSTSAAQPDELELPIAMVALAATAVGSCLLDWLRAGGLRPKKAKSFTADANSDIYAAHVAFLNSIKKDYPSKFHVLMHNLYMTLSGGTLKVVKETNHTMEQAMAVLDLDGMPDE